MVLQLLVIILNFVLYNYFVREAIFGLFFFLILYIIQRQISYLMIEIYIFISIFSQLIF